MFLQPAVGELSLMTPTTRGMRADAEYPYGDDVKAGPQRPIQKKMGVPPGYGIQYRRGPRGFEVAKYAPRLPLEATD